MKECPYKRLFDIFLSLFGIVFFLPLFLLFSFLVWLEDRGSIFYNQIRIGKNGKAFNLLKFRSMSMDSAMIPTSSLKDEDPRIKITKMGKFLRATAMDELPQVINILKGDMSFVGPRPIMLEEAQALDPAKVSVRLSVAPGLTGLAQLSADKYISNERKLEYDLEYIQKQSCWLDIKIILYSIWITLLGRWEYKGVKHAVDIDK